MWKDRECERRRLKSFRNLKQEQSCLFLNSSSSQFFFSQSGFVYFEFLLQKFGARQFDETKLVNEKTSLLLSLGEKGILVGIPSTHCVLHSRHWIYCEACKLQFRQITLKIWSKYKKLTHMGCVYVFTGNNNPLPPSPFIPRPLPLPQAGEITRWCLSALKDQSLGIISNGKICDLIWTVEHWWQQVDLVSFSFQIHIPVHWNFSLSSNPKFWHRNPLRRESAVTLTKD